MKWFIIIYIGAFIFPISLFQLPFSVLRKMSFMSFVQDLDSSTGISHAPHTSIVLPPSPLKCSVHLIHDHHLTCFFLCHSVVQWLALLLITIL